MTIAGQITKCAICSYWDDGVCLVEAKGRKKTEPDEQCIGDIREIIRQNAKWANEGKNVKKERERIDKMTKMNDEWTPDNCYDKAMEVFNQSGMPQPSLVKKYEDIKFPVDIDSVSNKELGDLLFEFGALKAYSANKTVEWDIRYHAMKLAKEIRMGYMVDQMEKAAEKKRLKEAMQADAVMTDSTLNSLVKKEIQAQSNYKKFNSSYEQFGIYWDTVSREITRRNDELKTLMRQDAV